MRKIVKTGRNNNNTKNNNILFDSKESRAVSYKYEVRRERNTRFGNAITA